MSQPAIQNLNVVKKYLETRRIVIADPGSASRSVLFQTLHRLGAKSQNIVMSNNFGHAMDAIQTTKPQMVVTEYDFGKRSGLELLQSLREKQSKEFRSCLFIIVTSNMSQTAVAKSAEEDVDAYILKPFNSKGVSELILKAAIDKLRPSGYQSAILEAKQLIEKGKLDEATVILERAKQLDAKPALAHYYLGQISFLKQTFSNARASFESGLELNRIHYRCMVGLYDLFRGQQDHTRAYDLVRRMSQVFPANPKRLTEVLRLAIVTRNYDDIERFYSTFTNIEERDDHLIRHVCAALIVCGRYYLSTHLGHARAIELFNKAAITAQAKSSVLRDIVLALTQQGLATEADRFLRRFSVEDLPSDDFLIARFWVSNAEGIHSLAVEHGRALMAKNIASPEIFESVIRHAHQAGADRIADEACDLAKTRFPEHEARFEKARLPKDSAK